MYYTQQQLPKLEPWSVAVLACSPSLGDTWQRRLARSKIYQKRDGLLAENTSLQLKPVEPFFWFFRGKTIGTEQIAANLRQLLGSSTESMTYMSGNKAKDSVNEPTAYGGYNEIAAAGQLYNLTVEVVVAGTDSPPPPVPPAPNAWHVLYHPHFVPLLPYAHTFFGVV